MPERFAVPVPCLAQQVAIAALLHRVLERLGGVLVVAFLETRAAAFERLRRDAEPRADARQRARRLDERGGLFGGGRTGNRRRKRRHLHRRRRQRQLDRERRILGRRCGERDDARQGARRRLERTRRCGAGDRQPDRGERDDASHDLPSFFAAPLGAGLGVGVAGLATRALTAVTRSRAQSRSVESGLRLATASYAVSAPFQSCCSSRASPSPASARNFTLPSTSETAPTASKAFAAAAKRFCFSSDSPMRSHASERTASSSLFVATVAYVTADFQFFCLKAALA